MVRLRAFLRSKNPLAAVRAGQTILRAIAILKAYPRIGRPVEDLPVGFRELPIDFGDSGYLALYRYDEGQDRDEEGGEVVIVALRHQREAGYR